MADREGVDIRYYSVIYQAIDEIEAALKGMLKPEFEEVQLGTAEIREVFRSSKFGNIAGSLVRSGEIRRNSKARLVRDGVVVADNLTIDSLKRFKDDATEVREGFECGIGLGSFNDIKVGDIDRDVRDAGEAARLSVTGSGAGGRTAAARPRPRSPWLRQRLPPEVGSMYVGTLTCDLLLGDVRSLKQKRSAVRPVVAELQAGVRRQRGRDRPPRPAPPGRGGGRRGRGGRRRTATVCSAPARRSWPRGRSWNCWPSAVVCGTTRTSDPPRREGHGTGETQAGTRTGN